LGGVYLSEEELVVTGKKIGEDMNKASHESRTSNLETVSSNLQRRR
jgi:hypothetical protein